MTTDDSPKCQAELIDAPPKGGRGMTLEESPGQLPMPGKTSQAEDGSDRRAENAPGSAERRVGHSAPFGSFGVPATCRSIEPERLLRQLLAAAPAIVWAVDAEGVVLLVEGKRARSLGLELGEPGARRLEEVFGRVPPLLENTRRALAGESLLGTLAIDRTILTCWQAPLRDETGAIIGAFGLGLDARVILAGDDESGGLTGSTGEMRAVALGSVTQPQRSPLEHIICQHERERRLLACELHDGLVQEMTAAQMHLEASLHGTQVPPGPAREQLQRALELVRRSVGEGRRLIRGLRPPVLDECGVVAAIESLIDESPPEGPSIKLIVDVPSARWEPLLETAVYRIAQEAIANVKRHSGADRAEVRLLQEGQWVRLEVRDWGVGFDPARVDSKRLGLQGIRERARLLGGRAVIQSAPGQGSRVLVELPLASASARGRS